MGMLKGIIILQGIVAISTIFMRYICTFITLQ